MKNALNLCCFGVDHPILFYTSTYTANDNLYVGMLTENDDGFIETWSDLTTNLGTVCSPICGFIDVANNSDNIIEWLKNNNLGRTTGRTCVGGYCNYPEFEFNMEELSKHLYEEEYNND